MQCGIAADATGSKDWTNGASRGNQSRQRPMWRLGCI
jgi:hypothetical protein